MENLGPWFSDRIDFSGIEKRFQALREKTKLTETIHEFSAAVYPVVMDVLKRYWYLLDDAHYIQGEFAGLIAFIVECVNRLMSPGLDCVARVSEDGTTLLFVQKSVNGKSIKFPLISLN